MRKIKRDDTVLVLAGRDRGKTGVVRQMIGGGDLVKVKGHRPKITEDKVFVTGVNISKRHKKQQRGRAQAGIIEKEMPLPICESDGDLQELQQAGARRVSSIRATEKHRFCRNAARISTRWRRD